jgi:sugar phosphate isomerase/epimerase
MEILGWISPGWFGECGLALAVNERRNTMRFGVCALLEKVDRLAAVGYDYIELNVQSVLMPEKSDAEFQDIRKRVAKAPIKPEVFSVFIPADLRVVGDSVQRQRLSSYVRTACCRARELGAEVIVYGSSGSRDVEEGYSREKALDQIAEFLKMAADHAETNGITVILEPICYREGNILRTVAEGLEMVQRVDRKGIRLLADLYHVWQEKEPMKNILDAAKWLGHVHVAEPVKRSYPGNDDFDFSDFFTALREARYNGRMSVECSFNDLDREIEIALRTIKAYPN